jgi:hypothetical protein
MDAYLAPCPYCRGKGRDSAGLLCMRCDGTGDREAMMLRRAYDLGRTHGRDEVYARMGVVPIREEILPMVGLARLRELLQAVEDESVRRGDAVLTTNGPPKRAVSFPQTKRKEAPSVTTPTDNVPQTTERTK